MNESPKSASVSLPMLPMSDHEHRCVYRPSQFARMPLLYPTRKLTPSELDDQLAMGRRRSGTYLYFTACPTCVECRPTRVWIDEFQLSKSMRRIWRRAERELSTSVNYPSDDEQRLLIFNHHRLERDLASTREAYTQEDFRSFLVDTCCESRELSFRLKDRLIGCSIVDVGERSLSAVYTFFDPFYSDYSIGTYAVLKQMELAKSLGKDLVYLGMYVADNQHLRYKGRYSPQERLIDGRWTRFDEPISNWTSKVGVSSAGEDETI
jgi:arginine-tRNA-protein transferase